MVVGWWGCGGREVKVKEWLAASWVETSWWASGVAGPRVVLKEALEAACSVAVRTRPAAQRSIDSDSAACLTSDAGAERCWKNAGRGMRATAAHWSLDVDGASKRSPSADNDRVQVLELHARPVESAQRARGAARGW